MEEVTKHKEASIGRLLGGKCSEDLLVYALAFLPHRKYQCMLPVMITAGQCAQKHNESHLQMQA